MWNVETEKFSEVRDVIVNETNFKVSRPVMRSEGVNLESSKDNKTDASDIMSKSVEKSQKSDNNKSDRFESNTETRSNKIPNLRY